MMVPFFGSLLKMQVIIIRGSRSMGSPKDPDLGSGCDHCGGQADREEGDALRCACGSLLARHVPGGVELKCRRCKRTVVIPLQQEAAGTQ